MFSNITCLSLQDQKTDFGYDAVIISILQLHLETQVLEFLNSQY